jgi:EAL domain-containing protein (putative c-di-GMP-specific phosphodiesterase class I)
VTPDVFIPAAERAGLIRPLTQTLLRKAMAEMASWPDDLSLSFNLSTHDLMSPNAIDAILQTVEASGIPASRIEFEITETAMMSDFNQARRAIDRISEAGHSVALDDFGIGYSSLQYLQLLPVSKLKIDHSFVRNILEDTSSFKIVRTLLSLSQTLGLGCVVEGVESPAQVHILRTMGARHLQGYLIGAPMKPEAIPGSLDEIHDFAPAAQMPPPPGRCASAG